MSYNTTDRLIKIRKANNIILIMDERFARTEMIIGKDGLEKLKNSRVIIFGIGGVGSYTAEAVARTGVGYIELVDNDTVSLSNINRQIIATDLTLGMNKTDVMARRIYSINPDCTVVCRNVFFLPENSGEFDFSQYDYIVDAVDTVSAKIEIAKKAQKCNIPVISSMGTGNKMNPLMFEVADIYKTSVCPLAKTVRKLCRENGIKKLKCVYSKEEPKNVVGNVDGMKKYYPGSISFTPPVAGLIIASEVIKDLLKV